MGRENGDFTIKMRRSYTYSFAYRSYGDIKSAKNDKIAGEFVLKEDLIEC